MKVRDLYTPGAQVTLPDAPLADAARTMLDQHVGALVVVEQGDPKRRPIGILTDRDIVRGQLRCSADLYCLNVSDVMTLDPLVLAADTDVTEAIEAMNTRAVRRAPLLDASGALAGMVSLDDLLPAIARELEAVASLMGTQARHEPARRTQ